MLEPIQVLEITAREPVTRLGFACANDSECPRYFTLYITNSRQFCKTKPVENNDGPITDSWGRPILFGGDVSVDRVFGIADPIFAPHIESSRNAKTAILPIQDMLNLFEGYGHYDEHDWIIFCLNLVYECFRPLGIEFPDAVRDNFWAMHDYFTFRGDVEGLFAETEVTCEEAQSVLRWSIRTIKNHARIIDE